MVERRDQRIDERRGEGTASQASRNTTRQPAPTAPSGDPAHPIGGNVLAGLTLILRSRYLLGVSLFVVLLATASTFLYFEQARLVEQAFPGRTRQTQVFSALDAIVQALTIVVQLFFSGRLARRHGVTALLTAVPAAVAVGFLLLAAWPGFFMLAAVMIVRRVGEYAMLRPGREMLFTLVDAETKYKAKNVIDTTVYRAGDAISAWVKTAIDAVAGHAAVVALAGASLCVIWAMLGAWLGRRADRGAAGLAAAPRGAGQAQGPRELGS